MVMVNGRGDCYTPNMVRCQKCSFVRKGADGWVCTANAEWDRRLPSVETVSDEDCPCEQEW